MIKFRQKNYAIPAAIGLIANSAMIGGTGISIWQGKKQQDGLRYVGGRVYQ